MKIDVTALRDNITDVIKEQQAKLGYEKSPVGLYYPLASLNRLTGAELSTEDMLRALTEADLPAGTKIARNGDVFSITLTADFCKYVRDNTPADEFIAALVDLVRTHSAKVDDIKALFLGKDPDAIIEPMDGGEFDFLIRFPTGSDRYYYCFKDEGFGHITYHRFLPEDYAEFGF